MSSLKRRHFLQAAGSTLAAIGLSQLDFLRQSHQYGQVLAQGTPRKLALLVGINSYPSASDLNGCLTDVELQRELLIHRFGFHPSDIVAVWDNAETSDLKPSRENILRAFREHLIAQAKPGDVVVFHFSGHGSRVEDPNPLETEECRRNQDCSLNGTMVPNDRLAQSGTDLVVPDIMGRSLFLLMQALDTENVTVVLDSCHSGGGTRGNTLVRSAQRLSRTGNVLASPQELEFQQALLAQLRLDASAFEQQRQRGIAKGVALGSARRDQLAWDDYFGGFSAGAFTYLLTRYLWQLPATEAAGTTYANLARSTQALASRRNIFQNPVVEFKPNSNNETKPLYFATPPTPRAEAVIQSIVGEQIGFWLGGVSAQNITSTSTVFTVLDPAGQVMHNPNGEPLEIQQTQRAGLFGYGQVVSGSASGLQPGQLLREKLVGIPTNPILRIGLDPSLGDDLEQARTALQTALLSENVNRLETFPVQPGIAIDYILGRMSAAYHQQLTAEGATNLPVVGSTGLFTPTLTPLRSSFHNSNEPIRNAVNRLRPNFRLLLVGQVLQDIASTESSLNVTGEVFSASGAGDVVPISSRGAQDEGSVVRTVAVTAQPFPAGDAIQVSIQSHDDRALYLGCIAVDSQGNLLVLHPTNWDSPDESARIDSRGTLTIPRAEDQVVFRSSGSGHIQILTLVSTAPLSNVLRGLASFARSRGIEQGFLPVRGEGEESTDLLAALVGDVGNLARSRGADNASLDVISTQGQTPIDTNELAAFSTIIEIRE